MDQENRFLRKKILNYFKRHTEVDSSRVKVEVENHTARLSGKVDGPVAKATLEGFAMLIEGIDNVINSIELDSENLSGVMGINIR